MKRTLICPKCTHRRLWHVEEARETGRGGLGGPQSVPLAVSVREGVFSLDRVGRFELMICARCGYTEWYAKELAELEENPRAGVRLIVNNVDVEGGPYR